MLERWYEGICSKNGDASHDAAFDLFKMTITEFEGIYCLDDEQFERGATLMIPQDTVIRQEANQIICELPWGHTISSKADLKLQGNEGCHNRKKGKKGGGAAAAEMLASDDEDPNMTD